MRHQDCPIGTLVRLIPECLTMDDMHGEPWKWGAGPFRVTHRDIPAGRQEPWFRIALPASTAILPGAFRAKHFRRAS